LAPGILARSVIAAIFMATAVDAGRVNIAAYTLLPFGQKVVSRAVYSGRDDISTGPLGVVGNLVWLVFAGWWLALTISSQNLSLPLPSSASASPESARPRSSKALRCAV
jgi:uncharacterized membrane protein YccF (DUF307 family)